MEPNNINNNNNNNNHSPNENLENLPSSKIVHLPPPHQQGITQTLPTQATQKQAISQNTNTENTNSNKNKNPTKKTENGTNNQNQSTKNNNSNNNNSNNNNSNNNNNQIHNNTNNNNNNILNSPAKKDPNIAEKVAKEMNLLSEEFGWEINPLIQLASVATGRPPKQMNRGRAKKQSAEGAVQWDDDLEEIAISSLSRQQLKRVKVENLLGNDPQQRRFSQQATPEMALKDFYDRYQLYPRCHDDFEEAVNDIDRRFFADCATLTFPGRLQARAFFEEDATALETRQKLFPVRFIHRFATESEQRLLGLFTRLGFEKNLVFMAIRHFNSDVERITAALAQGWVPNLVPQGNVVSHKPPPLEKFSEEELWQKIEDLEKLAQNQQKTISHFANQSHPNSGITSTNSQLRELESQVTQFRGQLKNEASRKKEELSSEKKEKKEELSSENNNKIDEKKE